MMKVSVKLRMPDDLVLADGQKAGLACMGRDNYYIGVHRTTEGRELFLEKDGEILASEKLLKAKKIWFCLSFDVTDGNNEFFFLYSRDGKRFLRFGDAFAAHNGFWKGARVALYSYNTERNNGTASFRDFKYIAHN